MKGPPQKPVPIDPTTQRRLRIEYPGAGAPGAAYIRLGEGGTAFWHHRSLASFINMAVGIVLFSFILASVVRIEDNDNMRWLLVAWTAALTPLLMVIAFPVLQYLDRPNRPATRIDWTPTTVTVTQQGRKQGQLGWNPQVGTVAIKRNELVFTTPHGTLRTPAPPIGDRRRMLKALNEPILDPKAPDWDADFDQQTITVPGHLGARGWEPATHWRDFTRIGGFGLATQLLLMAGCFFFFSLSNVWVATASAIVGLLCSGIIVNWHRGRTITRRLVVTVSNTHLELATTDEVGPTHRWLWDDIQSIEGHVDWMTILAGKQRVTLNLGLNGRGVGSNLIHDLQQRWRRSRATPDEREATLHAQGVLAGMTERS